MQSIVSGLVAHRVTPAVPRRCSVTCGSLGLMGGIIDYRPWRAILAGQSGSLNFGTTTAFALGVHLDRTFDDGEMVGSAHNSPRYDRSGRHAEVCLGSICRHYADSSRRGILTALMRRPRGRL